MPAKGAERFLQKFVEQFRALSGVRLISNSLMYVEDKTRSTMTIGERVATPGRKNQFTDLGFSVTVTPVVLSDGEVTLAIEQTNQDFAGYKGIGPWRKMVISSQKLEGTVTSRSGHLSVIGGLIKNDGKARTETLILVQPITGACPRR